MEFPLVSDNELVPEIPGRKENPNQEININKPSPGTARPYKKVLIRTKKTLNTLFTVQYFCPIF